MPKGKRKSQNIEKHHILPKAIQKKHLGRVYDSTTTPLTKAEHQQIHRDVRKHSVIGSLALHDLRKRLKRD